MTTEARTETQIENEVALLANGEQELAALHARIGPHFRRAEVRERVGRFLAGLLSRVERKNGWQLAEELDESGPQGVQRLLNAAEWDEEAVGVARQYSGTAGRRENSQMGVFLLYASAKGHAFIDRALYLPEEWTQDPVRCREAGVPTSVRFATKGELAQQMLAQAFAAGVQADWVVADSVYGYEEMRDWLESRHQKYVLAVPETHTVWSQGEQQPVGLLAALLPKEAWVPLSAGEGSQGPRLYEWAWLQLPYERAGSQGWASWVLIRRSLAEPSKRAYYRAWGPASTPLTTLVRVAGSRWTVEEGFEHAKGEVGLDQYEVRSWTAWYRFITLVLLAYDLLVVMRSQAQAQEQKKGQVSVS